MTAETDDIEIILDQPEAAPPVLEQGVEPAPKKPVVTEQDGVEDLRKQLAEAKAARERDKLAREQAELRANTAQQQVAQFQTAAQTAEYTSVSRALEATGREIEALEAQVVAAIENGDLRGAESKRTAIAKLAARQSQLEYGKEHMERARNAPRPAPQPVVTAAQPNVSARTQAWLEAHPDAMTTRFNSVMGAHHAALAAGHEADTDAYFEYVERAAGYKQAAPQPQRSAAISAPPNGTGRAPSGAPATNQVRLTVREQDTARALGLSLKEYAKHKADAIAAGDYDA